jgi:formylglycine-generating enzyme
LRTKAYVFNNGLIDFVSVGNPGNANDPTTGYGAVAYTYSLAKYEVTLNQYTAFLNAVAATDTYALYNPAMATDVNSAGISRSGSSGSYSYAVIGDGNRPVAYVSWFDAVRFANWVHNGRPSGAQTAATTEDGAYTLLGATSGVSVNKNVTARYWIPSENEWYKAAYHQSASQGGDSDDYWLYPTASNVTPNSRNGSSTDANSANFFLDDGIANGFNGGYAVSQATGYSSSQQYLTPAGAFTLAKSFYGTFDQGGNVWEWNDAVTGSARGWRGGSWFLIGDNMRASLRSSNAPVNEYADVGFRLAATAAPLIAQQPQSQTVILSSNATFTVSAVGIGPLTYQWLFNGSVISGGTNNFLTITNVSFANVGNSYQVIITNSYGSVTSSVATLRARLSGITHLWPGEGNANDVIGGLNATANGGLNYTNGQIGSAFNLNGTSAYLQVPPDSSLLPGTGAMSLEGWVKTSASIQAEIFWMYDCGGTCDGPSWYGLEIEANGHLTAILRDVNDHLQTPVSTQVLNNNVWHHVVVVRNVGANQLQLYVDGILDTSVALTATSNIIDQGEAEPLLLGAARETGGTIDTFFSGQLDDLAYYNRALTGAEVQLLYQAGAVSPAITQQPQSQTIILNSNATFTVTAVGFNPLAYQWYFNGAGIAGGTNSSLVLSNVTFGSAGNYQIIITNAYGSVTSSVAVLSLTWPTLARNDAFTVVAGAALTNLAAQLLANDLAGSSNGANTNLTLIAVSPVSANGGSVTFRPDGGSPVWTNYYNGTGNSYYGSTSIAVDGNGNVYVAGTLQNSGGNQDFATIAYSGSGVPLWTNRYNGPVNSNDNAVAVAVATNGNVYVAGTSYGIGGNQGYATIAYSGAGVPLWTNRYNSPWNGNDSVSSMKLDQNGNIYVTGNSLVTVYNSDYVTIKYSSAGVPLWTNRYDIGSGAHPIDSPSGMAVDLNGDVIVTGSSQDPYSFYDYLTIKYSSAGVPLWTNRYNANPSFGYDDYARAVTVDQNGNVYVTGASELFGNSFPNSLDYATIKYSSTGVLLWVNRYSGAPNYGDDPSAIAVDQQNGNVYVTGLSFVSPTPQNFYSSCATIAYSSAGAALWTQFYSETNSYVSGRSLAVDGNGNVLVAGDGFAIKYSSTGLAMWTNRFAVGGNLVALDGSGNVFVTAGSSTIKYSGSPDLFYTPPINFIGTDTFTYTVRDSLGQTATGTVSVLVLPDADSYNRIAIQKIGGNVRVAYLGNGGANYALERTFNLVPPALWVPLVTNPAPFSSYLYFTNPLNPATNNFWRIRAVP